MKGSRSIIATAIALGLLAGSTVGVTAQEEDAAVSPPVEFTGRIVCGPEVRSGTDEWIPDAAGSSTGLSRERGDAWQPTATMSDPRLEGTYHFSGDFDEYRGSEGTATIGAATWRIENAEGAWQGSLTHAWPSDSRDASASAVLVGEGAYEGLLVFWEEVGHLGSCSWDVRGLIVEGEPPAAPEPFIGE